jgi:hypothetical protein
MAAVDLLLAARQAPAAATALVALGLIGTDDPVALRTVHAALTDRRNIVRWGAAVTLARLHGPADDAAGGH